VVEKSAPPEKRLELTELKERFARKYVELLGNGGKAAKAAGCNCSSDESFRAAASEFLTDPNVVSRIEQIRERSLKRTEITAARVLNELARVAFASMGDFADWGPNGVTLRESSELSQDELAVVEEVSETPGKETTHVRIKLASKLSALDKLCKNLGLTPDKFEHGGPGGGPIGILSYDATQSMREKLLADLENRNIKTDKDDENG